MEKRDLRKNRLDLEYQGEAQKANAFLILLTTGMLAFVGTFIWQKTTSALYIGIIITIMFSLMGWKLYQKSMRRMKEILNEIENI